MFFGKHQRGWIARFEGVIAGILTMLAVVVWMIGCVYSGVFVGVFLGDCGGADDADE